MHKAVFIDKDGTLIVDVPYNADPAKIRLQQHTLEGLQELKASGYLLVVITNQPGIAWGYFKEEALEMVRTTLDELVRPAGIRIDGFYYCPHHPKGNIARYAITCNCRKPLPGMILRAAEELNIDLQRSWMVGDILHDVEAGHKAGCRSILINNGNETEWEAGNDRTPDFVADSINEAACQIMGTKMIHS